jgi:hypothetical protein
MAAQLTMASLEVQPLAKSFQSVFMGAAGGGVELPSDDEFNRVSSLLHFDGTNNGTNNVFDDSSSSNHTITANGNVTQGSFGPFARPDGEWAVAFDGSGDSVTTPENAATRIAQSNFTFEAFIFPTGGDSNEDTIFTQGADGVYSPFNVFVKSNKITLYISTTGSSWNIANNQSSSNSVAINSWTHVALVRNGATIQLYINGVADNSYSVGTNTFFTPTQVTSVGSRPAGDRPFKGYISNVRLVIGTAVYTSAFTPPTSKLTAVTNTKLLTCQSNRFVDNSATGLAVSITGNPAVSAFGPFLTSSVYGAGANGASAYFVNEVGEYLDTPVSSDFAFGTGDFTVEFWFYQEVSGYRVLIDQVYANLGISIWINDSRQLTFYYDSSAGGGLGVAITAAINYNEWNHVALVRSSGVTRIYANGVSGATYSDSNNYTSTTGLTVSADYNANTYLFKGYMSDVRAVKGTAVYTANFTPPTAPLTAVTNTKLLLNMADGQAIDSAAQNNLTLVGDAKISNAQAKFGDTSIYFDGTGDEAKYFSNGFGTGDFTMEAWVYPQTQSQRYPAVYYVTNGSSNRVAVQFDHDSNPNKFRCNVAGTVLSPSGTNAVDQWYHTAVVRYQGVVTFYIDGTSVGSTAYTHNVGPETSFLGGNTPISVELNFKGFIDDFRVSNTARYTANFTPPTEPFADKGQ